MATTHTFYFVRHGESILNTKGIRQGREGALSEKGIAQASTAGEMLRNKKATVMIASPYERTIQTANTINTHLHIPIEYSELFIERRNPSEIIGKSIDEPEVAHVINLMDKSYHDDNFRYSDEENFADMKKRAKKCLEFLETRKEKNIVVVTHSIFLKLLASYIMLGEKLTASEYNKLSFYNYSNNAGITIASYTNGFFSPKKEERWKLLEWDIHPIKHTFGIPEH